MGLMMGIQRINDERLHGVGGLLSGRQQVERVGWMGWDTAILCLSMEQSDFAVARSILTASNKGVRGIYSVAIVAN